MRRIYGLTIVVTFLATLLLVLGTVGSVLGAGIPVQQFTPQAASTSTASRWC